MVTKGVALGEAQNVEIYILDREKHDGTRNKNISSLLWKRINKKLRSGTPIQVAVYAYQPYES